MTLGEGLNLDSGSTGSEGASPTISTDLGDIYWLQQVGGAAQTTHTDSDSDGSYNDVTAATFTFGSVTRTMEPSDASVFAESSGVITIKKGGVYEIEAHLNLMASGYDLGSSDANCTATIPCTVQIVATTDDWSSQTVIAQVNPVIVCIGDEGSGHLAVQLKGLWAIATSDIHDTENQVKIQMSLTRAAPAPADGSTVSDAGQVGTPASGQVISIKRIQAVAP